MPGTAIASCSMLAPAGKSHYANGSILARWFPPLRSAEAVLFGAGPPQTFSQAGAKDGFGDPRGMLFLEIVSRVPRTSHRIVSHLFCWWSRKLDQMPSSS